MLIPISGDYLGLNGLEHPNTTLKRFRMSLARDLIEGSIL